MAEQLLNLFVWVSGPMGATPPELLVRRMTRERENAFQAYRWLNPIGEKIARARGTQARMSAGKVN